MKAVSATDLPADDSGWAYEIKWDGMRLLAFVGIDGAGVVRLRTTNGIDATPRFPEFERLADAVGGRAAVLDGEAVAFDDAGRPSFGRLQHRMHVVGAAEVRRRAEEVPVCFLVFDLLWLDGHDVTSLPYTERRRLLAELFSPVPGVQMPEHRIGDGAALLGAAAERGLEGVMAKRLDSRYEPGRRSPAWRKVKVRRRQEFVVGGWQPGEKGRAGRIGSLLLGYYEDGHLRFAGKVGTGFTQRELAWLDGILAPLARATSPFDPSPPRIVDRVARYVEPVLVAEIEFGEWTLDGILRHPSYLGLRDDKAATDVVREI